MTHATEGGKAAARKPERCSRCHRIFRVNEACNIFDGALVCFDCEPIKPATAVADPQGGGATSICDKCNGRGFVLFTPGHKSWPTEQRRCEFCNGTGLAKLRSRGGETP